MPADRRHEWHLSFDRVCCRDCDVLWSKDVKDGLCPGTTKIRPRAACREAEERR